MNNIAVYGGGFNPPTLSHAKVITSVLEKTQIEKIIFAPDGERKDKDYKIPPIHRKKLQEIFFSILKSNGLDIEFDSHFLEGKNGGYTNTMQVREYYYKKLGYYPWHIFGTDVAKDMPKWTGNHDKIIEEKLKKIFINRPGIDFNPEGLDNYMLIDITDMLEISSTMAREMIKNKQKTNGVLFPKIREYIDDNLLYLDK